MIRTTSYIYNRVRHSCVQLLCTHARHGLITMWLYECICTISYEYDIMYKYIWYKIREVQSDEVNGNNEDYSFRVNHFYSFKTSVDTRVIIFSGTYHDFRVCRSKFKRNFTNSVKYTVITRVYVLYAALRTRD